MSLAAIQDHVPAMAFGSLESSSVDASPLLVLKFGGSVLRGMDDLPRVAGEIYRQRRRGFAVVAVVSALHGETDRLFAEAGSVALGTACAGVADLVSLGEARTAALLRIACDRIGLPAVGCQPEELGLLTTGAESRSRPVALDAAALNDKLARTGLVIVPGFVGIGADGGRTLLERGGSDFSAVYLGGELGAAAVRLYKDTDGVFEIDPKRNPTARRYDKISWGDARRVAGPLIQSQAVEYAAAKKLPIEVEAIGSTRVTRVGPQTGTLTLPSCSASIRVAIAGYGTVGQSVAQRLASEPRFEIVSTLVRDTARPRAYPSPVESTSSYANFVASRPDIVVDALSCAVTSKALCADLLGRGTHIASASKRMVNDWIVDGCETMSEGPGTLVWSAAVGGGTPMLELIGRTRGVTGLWGILNGTVNFVLSALASGASLDEALAHAHAAGFAEENADADFTGADAAAKLRILAHRAFGGLVSEITTETLDATAAGRIKASGERWVQVSRLTSSGTALLGTVSLVPMSALSVPDLPTGEWNCLFLERGQAKAVMCIGRGAGGAATAEAIVADLYDLADLPKRSKQ